MFKCLSNVIPLPGNAYMSVKCSTFTWCCLHVGPNVIRLHDIVLHFGSNTVLYLVCCTFRSDVALLSGKSLHFETGNGRAPTPVGWGVRLPVIIC